MLKYLNSQISSDILILILFILSIYLNIVCSFSKSVLVRIIILLSIIVITSINKESGLVLVIIIMLLNNSYLIEGMDNLDIINLDINDYNNEKAGFDPINISSNIRKGEESKLYDIVNEVNIDAVSPYNI